MDSNQLSIEEFERILKKHKTFYVDLINEIHLENWELFLDKEEEIYKEFSLVLQDGASVDSSETHDRLFTYTNDCLREFWENFEELFQRQSNKNEMVNRCQRFLVLFYNPPLDEQWKKKTLRDVILFSELERFGDELQFAKLKEAHKVYWDFIKDLMATIPIFLDPLLDLSNCNL
ncbi:hypothetical protein SNEBB_010837 [Seison nebaliae]|nr:hypothetical protein SNEBB_010837 [Seison nebaliae]